MAEDTAPAKQRTERAHRSTGAKWPRTSHMQHNTPSGYTGEQEPSGPGPVNKSQVVGDTAHAT